MALLRCTTIRPRYCSPRPHSLSQGLSPMSKLTSRHFLKPSHQASDAPEIWGSLAKPPSLCRDLLFGSYLSLSQEKMHRGVFFCQHYDNSGSTLHPQAAFLARAQVLKLRSSTSLASALGSPLPSPLQPPAQHLHTACPHFPDHSSHAHPWDLIPLSVCSSVISQASL